MNYIILSADNLITSGAGVSFDPPSLLCVDKLKSLLRIIFQQLILLFPACFNELLYLVIIALWLGTPVLLNFQLRLFASLGAYYTFLHTDL